MTSEPKSLGGDDTRVSTTGGQVQGPKEASLVQIYGPTLGQRYPIEKQVLTIGRDESCDIVLDNDNVSRAHGRVTTDGPEVRYEDLGSTNGTLINDREVTSMVLRSGDLLKIGSVMLKFLSGGSAEALYHEEIYRLTIHDGLTAVPNRRHFDDFLERELARAARYERPLALMLFDIDHFKKVNDDFGHLAGDYVLRRLAGILHKMIRREELLARYGGEEFAIVMPEAPLQKAKTFGEKIRATVEETEFEFDGRKIDVTTSVGVSCLTKEMTRDRFIAEADQALYRAKETGRNRVCGFDELDITS